MMPEKKVIVMCILAVAMTLSMCGCVGNETTIQPVDGEKDAMIESSATASGKSEDREEELQAKIAGKTEDSPVEPEVEKKEQEMSEFFIYANGHRLAVEPQDNSSAAELMNLLAEGDITVSAHDYGNFEKVGGLPQSFPTNDEQITTEPGDVILYQGNQITVYYDENTWNFTRLGKIKNVTDDELRSVLGEGDVELRLSLE